MPRTLKHFITLALIGLAFSALHAQQKATDRAPTVTQLDKHQLGAVLVALRETHKMGLSIRGQGVRISDDGKNLTVSFIDDPINMAMVGSEGGVSFLIRKRDLKLLRLIHDR
jgi:hypothetical protein